MNERIQKFAEMTDEKLRNVSRDKEWLENFAELIVRECISQIEKQCNGLTSTEWDEGYRAGLNASQHATKKHFGVK